jgi:uncharacterized protein
MVDLTSPSPGDTEVAPEGEPRALTAPRKAEKKKSARLPLRAWTRAVHRDAGHLAVGLTIVYAASGIAVNHIKDWEPNFESYQRPHELGGPIAGTDEEAAAAVLTRLGLHADGPEVYRAAPDDLQIVLEKRTLHVNTATGHVLDEGQNPRFFLRVANWLHLNRGKRAWTLIADIYAAGLLLLAISGMFITPGRKGLLGRGGFLVLAGALVPIVYVQLSGGPEHASGRPAMQAPAAP